jgi:hypothetical protein
MSDEPAEPSAPLADSPHLTWYSLPREVREMIYTYALIQASPIIVWSGIQEEKTTMLDTHMSQAHAQICEAEVIHELPRHISTCNLAINLLVCETRLGREAAAVFYGKNTFVFQGHHNWTPIASWLRVIGNKNRNLLRSLEITAARPDQAWQTIRGKNPRYLPGTCTSESSVCPCNRCLENAEKFPNRGVVDDVNPAIETIFALIGKRSRGWELTVSMQLPLYYPCGTEHSVEDVYSDVQWYGHDLAADTQWYCVDLASLVEKYLGLHTRECPTDNFVDVIWTSRDYNLEPIRPPGKGDMVLRSRFTDFQVDEEDYIDMIWRSKDYRETLVQSQEATRKGLAPFVILVRNYHLG